MPTAPTITAVGSSVHIAELPEIGEAIGRYRIVGELGAGAMGTVFLASDPQLGRRIAVKVLTRSSRDDRLLDEARAMARLQHPNVVAIHDVGRWNDRIYIAMEHVAGMPLSNWLDGHPDWRERLDAFRQAATGLAAAHRAELVHHDVKPSNIMVGEDGRVRLVDFGLARSTPEMAAGSPAGTPRYMSPEQRRGEVADARTDQFSLCVALYEAVFGAHPFAGDAGLLDANRLDAVVPTASDVPPSIRDAVLRGLAAEPDQRHPSMEALIDALALAPPRRTRVWWIAGGAALAMGGGIALAVALSGEPALDCDQEDNRFADVWNAQRRGQLTALPGARKHALDLALGLFDRRSKALTAELGAVCRARRDGELTETQAAARESCVERRAIELDAVVTALITKKRGSEIDVADPTQCAEIVAPAMIDRELTRQLYAQFASAPLTAESIDTFEAIARQATAIGELELAARAELMRAILLRVSDHPAEADAVFQQVHASAVVLHAGDVATRALTDRSEIANQRGDVRGAARYAQLAVDAADKQHGVSPRLRAWAYNTLARAESSRGDRSAALGHAQKGLEIITAGGHVDPIHESQIRGDLIAALAAIDGQHSAAVAAAREALEFARNAFGEHDYYFATALQTLANTYRLSGDPHAATPYYRQALEVMIEVAPGPSFVSYERFALATSLVEDREWAEARKELERVRGEIAHNQALTLRPEVSQLLGKVMFYLGDYAESIHVEEEAIEDLMAQKGREHPSTVSSQQSLASMFLELGRVDDAQRVASSIERTLVAGSPSQRAFELALFRASIVAEIDRQRGKAREAEVLVRRGFEAFDKIPDGPHKPFVQSALWFELGRIHVDQKRYAEARGDFERATEVDKNHNGDPDELAAACDVQLARIEARTGHRAKALALARHAKQILATRKSDVSDLRVATAIIAGKKP